MEKINSEEILKEYENIIHLDEMLKGINSNWSNLEKALYIYINLEAILEKVDSKNVAAIYDAIMKKIDIPSKVINGVNDNAWNEIEIDGQYYPLDLAWDCDYFHSKESEGKIGICRFLVDKAFYENPKHFTKEIDIKQIGKVRALDPEIVQKALNNIQNKKLVREIEPKPTITIKSKELNEVFEKNLITEETVGKIEETKISLTDGNLEDLKNDINQIARYYPALLHKVEISNSTKSKENIQTVVDELYKAKASYSKSPEAKSPISITISSDRAEDFDLDFSNAPKAGTTTNATNGKKEYQSIILRNTGTSTIDFPNIMNKMSSNIEGLTIEGFYVKNNDLANTSLKKIAFKSKYTTFDNGITGLGGVGEVEVSDLTDAEFNKFMAYTYPANPNIFDLSIERQNLRGRHILDELAINPDLTSLDINSSHLDNLHGINKLYGRLAYLGLSYNDLSIGDVDILNEFKKRTPSAFVSCNSNSNIESEIRRNALNISKESVDFIRKQLDLSGDAYSFLGGSHYRSKLNDSWQVINQLYRFQGDNIPYYIKDAKIIRDKLKLLNQPMMLEKDSEIHTVDFTKSYLKNGKILLTLPQMELLINSGRAIPQDVIIKIESIKELDAAKVRDIKQRANSNGVNVTGVQIFDKNHDNNYTMITPYSLSEYVYIRETLDMVANGIDPSESDLDKFTTVYLRLANSIIYDVPATEYNSRRDCLYNWKVTNTCRNLINGLKDGKCVCAGYADILRNALDLVGIEARKNGGRVHYSDPKSGHAWNQVKIDGKWYYTDLTWDRQKDDTLGDRKNFDWMLKGKNEFLSSHQLTRNPNIENVEDHEYDRVKLNEAINRAKRRSFDFTKGRDRIYIPSDPKVTLQIDDDKIRDEFKRRTDDMYAKYYGDKEYQKEYEERSARYRTNEMEVTDGTIIYRTVGDYTEKEDDEKFLLLDKYKECLERMTKYEAGDTSVYTGTQAQIEAKYHEDQEYVQTRNHTFNQHEFTQRDLRTLGKFGERVPYIPQQQGALKNIGRAIGNTGIFFRNTIYAPLHRVAGRFIAQPFHRLVTRGKDASPYKNNVYHRLVARRNYFLDEARKKDQEETQNRMRSATDPSTVKPVNHAIRNYFSSRFNAVFNAKKGNEAVLRAGAADIKENIKEQERQRVLVKTMEAQVLDYRKQINDLNTMLSFRPYAANRLDVLDAINDKTTKMNVLEQQIRDMSIDATSQTDAISSDQHAIASKEVNTLRTTVIKGVVKGLSIRYVGPKIENWLLERGKTVQTYQIPGQKVEESKVWVPTTYKEKTTPIYETVLDTNKSMKDVMAANKGKDITGFYSVYGGENRPDIYQLTGDEKITAVFQSVGKGGTGLSDKMGLQAPVLTDKSFANSLLDSSGLLKQDTTIDQLLKGLQAGNLDQASLDNIYVSVGDRYWTKLSDLTGDLVKDVKVGEITQKVIDEAGHYDTIKNVIDTTKTATKTVMNPTIQTGVKIGKKTAKGVVAVDTLMDLVENVRPTTTDVNSNKKKPREYEYNDNDINNIPTSKKDYDRSR